MTFAAARRSDALRLPLEQRLSASFQQVSERLEQVRKGLGEMHTLATGVGDLKRVLTNVKTRGAWGEVRLGAPETRTRQIEKKLKNVEALPGADATKLLGESD